MKTSERNFLRRCRILASLLYSKYNTSLTGIYFIFCGPEQENTNYQAVFLYFIFIANSAQFRQFFVFLTVSRVNPRNDFSDTLKHFSSADGERFVCFFVFIFFFCATFETFASLQSSMESRLLTVFLSLNSVAVPVKSSSYIF